MNLKDKFKNILTGLPSKVKIGKRYVGLGESVFVIAEIGINHNGDIGIAKKLIDVAVEAGADAVKFQKRTTEEILTKEGLNKPYNSPHAFAPTYGEHRDKLEFSRDQYIELKKYSEERNVQFFASVWDVTSTDFMDKLGVDAYKIPSADLINISLLEYVASKNKPVLLSTGMNTEEEIDDAVSTMLKFNNKLILFHCLSLYPSPHEKINMQFMDVLAKRFSPLPVGYSGHELDLLPTIVAVSRGACIVERHLTLDKKMKGGDHSASLEPSQFKELVSSIREIEKIMGVPGKIMYDELKPLREKLAKSLVAKKNILKGDRITLDMLAIKGPGHGIKPKFIHDLVGKIAQEDVASDRHLPLAALNWPER